MEWSRSNHLLQNVNKTRKMVLDFRKEEDSSTAGTHPVNVVEECRYLLLHRQQVVYQNEKGKLGFLKNQWMQQSNEDFLSLRCSD